MHRPRSGAQAMAWEKANAGASLFRDSDPNIGEFKDAATPRTFGEVRGSCGLKNRMIYRKGELQENATAVESEECVS